MYICDWSSDVCSSDQIGRAHICDWSSDVCSSDLMRRHTKMYICDWSSDVCSSDPRCTSVTGVQTCALPRAGWIVPECFL